MDDVVNRFAKELADAIAAAVADNPQVEACRARAREAGFDMRVTLEAVVGFVNRTNGGAVTKITTPSRLLPAKLCQGDIRATGVLAGPGPLRLAVPD